MSRYVFFNTNAQDVNVLTAAKKVARSQGATVLKSLAGTMLLELTPAKAALVAQALPGWRYVAESKTTRVPERRPFERAKARGAALSTTAKALRLQRAGRPDLERLEMKDTGLHPPAPRPTNRRNTEYVPASEVRALFANGLDAREQRLGAADMISTDEAAELLRTTRMTINAWIAKGRAIGLRRTRRSFRMPRWQFEPPIWNALPRVSAALGTADGWRLLSFMESPHGALNGITPRQAIEQGQTDKVTTIAEHEGN